MHFNKLAKRILIFLVITTFFSIFSINLSYSAIPSCLSSVAQNNSIYYFPNVDYTCDFPGNYDFSNLNNFTIDCNNRFFQARSGANIDVTNSLITFKDCDIRISGGGTWIDNLASDVIMNNSIYNQAFTPELTLGDYAIFQEVFIEPINRYNEVIDNFYLSFNSPQTFMIWFYNSSTNYLQTYSYSSGAVLDYNNYSITLGSINYGSLNTTNVNLSNNYNFQLTLEDIVPPNLIQLNSLISNDSMKFDAEFSEPVNGSFMILYMNNSIVKEIIFNDYDTKRFIEINDLIPYSQYQYAFNDVYDRFGNGPISYPLTTFQTYETINAITNPFESYTFTGDPQNTTEFNFTSLINNIKVQFLEPVNISGIINISNYINISSNFIHIDSFSVFNKAARLYFSNLLFPTTPVILKNNSVCISPDCNIESYIGSELIFNVTGFSNYSLISNSALNSSYKDPFIGLNTTIYANYSKTQNNTPILNSSCNLTINSNTYNMSFNSSLNLYEIELPLFQIQNYPYSIFCSAQDYDPKIQNFNITTLYQPIDNFTVIRTIVPKDGNLYLTQIKNISVTINSFGTNNTDTYLDNEYSFLISKYLPISSSSYTESNDLTSWINISKEESFTIYNLGENNTFYEFSNGTIKNISTFIFTDEFLEGEGTSFYVNVRSCTFGNYCVYNSSQYYIFLDTTEPEYYEQIEINEFYNSRNWLNFSFYVRDFESGLESVNYGVDLYPNFIMPSIPINNFNNNQRTNYDDYGHDFLEGRYYHLRLETFNKRLSAQPSYELSSKFLIDTIAPQNSSFNVSLNNRSYTNTILNNFTFDLGEDYNFNYTLEGLNYSGIDYMEIYLRNATLEDDICHSWTDYQKINQTFNITHNNYLINLTSSHCYNVSYIIYDKAKNYNISYFEKIIKVDNTRPQINVALEEIPYNRVEKSIFELDSDLTVYTLSWDISDLDSTVDYYEIFIYDNVTNSHVKNFTLNGSGHNSFEVKYDSDFIKDGHTYFNTIRARNKAGLYSLNSSTDGVSFYVLKIPKVEPSNSLIIENNLNTNYFKILDYVENGTYLLELEEINGFNTTCRVHTSDFSYTVSLGQLCSGSNTPGSSCLLNLSLGNNFHVSCINNQFVDSYNNRTNNLDIELVSQKNVLPQIESINFDTNFSNPYTLYENESLNLNLILSDNNTLNYMLLNSTLKIGNLSIYTNTTNLIQDQIQINFINSSLYSEPNLTISNYVYNFYFNNSINHSKIIDLHLLSEDYLLNITSTNNNEYLFESYYNEGNFSKTYNNGVSNRSYILGLTSPYNITLENNNIFWDIENHTIRKDLFNLSILIGDDLDYFIYNLTVNLTPVIYEPKINETYLNSNNNFNLQRFIVYKYNLSNYFYEENSVLGLIDNLTFSYKTSNYINVLDFNKYDGTIYLLGNSTQNSSLNISVKNILGMEKSVILNFSIDDTIDNSIPDIYLNSPLNGSSYTLQNKNIYVNLSSNENLSSIKVYHNNIKYIICSGFCNSYDGLVPIPSLNLSSIINYLNFTIEDYAQNKNSILITINFELDSDGDSIPNLIDSDSDGDSIDDIFDKILWINNSVTTNINQGHFYINSSSNLSINYIEQENIEYKNFNNQTFMNFTFDFNTSKLNLLDVSIVYDSLNNEYIYVNGLRNISGTKNLFLPNHQTKSLVCIKDENIYSITQISNNCNQINEQLLDCSINQSSNGYSCNQITKDSNDYFMISGLTHSGIKLMCRENWIYEDWSSCNNNIQTRVGTVDLNNCGTQIFRTQSQSCISPPPSNPSSGGSSGGGGGGGSSSGSFFPTITDDNSTDTQNESSNQDITDNQNDNIIILPISLGSIEDGFNIEIEENKSYSFTFNGILYEGKFIFGDDLIRFNSKNNNFDFFYGENELDLNNDSINDAKYTLEFDREILTLNLNSIKSELQIEDNDNQITQIPQTIQEEEKNNFSSYLIAILFIIILLGLIGYGSYYYIASKKRNQEKEYNYQTIASLEKTQPFSKERNHAQSYEQLVDDLLNYSQTLKEEVLSEEDLFNKLHNQAIQLVRTGYSWTDIYYYLKDKKLSNFFIKKIIDFKYLADKFEDFYNKIDKRENPQNLRNQLLTQNWFSECYIFDGDGSKILNDVLFMFAGANIYGFSKDRFLEVLEDEFRYGLKNTKPQIVEITRGKLEIKDINILLELQKKIENLKQNSKELKDELKTLEINNFSEIDKLIDDMIHFTNKHLEDF